MSFVETWLLAPLAHEFMQRALIVALMVGGVCAVLSCFLVLKGWSLMGDAVSHAILPGIVLAHVTGLPFALGAFGAGLGCALGIGYLKQNSRVKEDTAMGIVFSGMFALGLVLFVKVDSDQHLMHILFGDMLGVRWPDIAETAAIALPTAAIRPSPSNGLIDGAWITLAVTPPAASWSAASTTREICVPVDTKTMSGVPPPFRNTWMAPGVKV